MPRTPNIRWAWRIPSFGEEPGVGVMRFRSVNPASEPDGLGFNDWIPLDAATWHALHRLEGSSTYTIPITNRVSFVVPSLHLPTHSLKFVQSAVPVS